MFNLFKTKFIIKIVKKVNDSYELIKTFNIKTNVDEIEGNVIDFDKPFYRNGLKLYYFIEQTSGQIYSSKTNDKRALITLADMIVNKSIIKQLSANLDKMREKLIRNWLIIGIAIGTILGGCIGYIIGIS